MISTEYGNRAMRLIINEMRVMNHPAKSWEIEFCHGQVRGVAKVISVSPEVMSEALAEVDALRRNEPAKPYERAAPNQASSTQHQF